MFVWVCGCVCVCGVCVCVVCVCVVCVCVCVVCGVCVCVCVVCVCVAQSTQITSLSRINRFVLVMKHTHVFCGVGSELVILHTGRFKASVVFRRVDW